MVNLYRSQHKIIPAKNFVLETSKLVVNFYFSGTRALNQCAT